MNIDSAIPIHSSQETLEKRKNELISAFGQILDSDAIIADVETQKPYECDGLAMYCALPLLVVMPETVPQVQAIMRICHEQNVPVVARGSGTGLSAGAMPHEQGVLLSMSRFSQILRIDPKACTATLQPGVRNLEITEAAAIHGLYYAPDPSSQIACSIGGNVAENSGGVHCL
ncbi:MAG: FAD-binding protein, partial [Pseudomonadales bacterium]